MTARRGIPAGSILAGGLHRYDEDHPFAPKAKPEPAASGHAERLEALAQRIRELTPPERLRLAAALLEEGRAAMAWAVVDLTIAERATGGRS